MTINKYGFFSIVPDKVVKRKPCLTSAISWQDFRKVTDDGMVLNKLNPATNAVQVVGQYEGHFDGVGYAKISGNGVYNKYSIMVKFKSEVSQTNNRPLFSQAHNAVDDSYGRPELGIHKDGFMYSTRGWNGSTYDMQVSNISVLDNKFHTGIITVDSESGVIKTYLDGILFGISDECVYPLKLEYLNVKEQCEIASRRTKGRYANVVISNLRICNRVLTEEEIVSESFEVNILDLDFSTGKENKIYDKSPEHNHATLVNMDLVNFWQQGEGKPTLALEGCNYSTATGYIPARNDGSGLDALGNPIQIKPLDWINLPLYSFRYPSSLPIMDKSNTTNWSDNTGGFDWSYDQLKSIPSIKKLPIISSVFTKYIPEDRPVDEVIIYSENIEDNCLKKTLRYCKDNIMRDEFGMPLRDEFGEVIYG